STNHNSRLGPTQLAAARTAFSVAILAAARYFFDHGITDLFMPYPVWATTDAAETLTTLATDGVLAVGTDSVAAVHQLADVTRQHPGVEIMIEVNSGHNRSGVFPDQVVPIAEAIRDRNMVLRGVFTFPGHSNAPGEHTNAAEDEARTLKAAERYLHEAGFDVPVLSGGSSPSAL